MAGQVIQPGTTAQTAGKLLTGNISAAAANLKKAEGTVDVQTGENPTARFPLYLSAFSPCVFIFDVRPTGSTDVVSSGGSVYVDGTFTSFGAVDNYNRPLFLVYRYGVGFDVSWSGGAKYMNYTLAYKVYGV